MTEEEKKEKTFLEKMKDGYKAIQKELVQEDNPNSPHKVISRMNAGLAGTGDSIVGSIEATRDQSPPPSEKKKKETVSPEDRFNRLVWGDE
jgi:hypothetical protein